MMDTTERGTRPIRIANISGFFGDHLGALAEMLDGPDPIDIITGDYLAELTMLILWKQRQRNPEAGYASTFLRQIGASLMAIKERGVRVVVNAGGLNPGGLASRLREIAITQGVELKVAHLEGDDLIPSFGELIDAGEVFANLDTGATLVGSGISPVTANAYLGCWGIVRALEAGADIVICPRVTDASIVMGPVAHWFGWSRTDWDFLAGALVAGHVIECGPQATGGNYSFLSELPDDRYPGFPIAEIDRDGTTVITKQSGTGGLVSIGTVTAQLLYEIGGPEYLNPDVIARFDTIHLDQLGPDRVRISGVRGLPPTDTLKVSINYVGGYRNAMTMVLTGLDIEEKARRAETMLFNLLGGKERFDEVNVQLLRCDAENAPSNIGATSQLKVQVKSQDRNLAGRTFSSAVIELSLASYPGFFPTTPPSSETEYGVYWPALVRAALVEQRLVHDDGSSEGIPHTGELHYPPVAIEAPPRPGPLSTESSVTTEPLGRIAGARSGDKGGNANVGFWCPDDAAFAYLSNFLDEDQLRLLLPEAADLGIRRHLFPGINALNFVIEGLLGEGVASSTRFDPQAKGLGEYLRSRFIPIPTSLLDASVEAVDDGRR